MLSINVMSLKHISPAWGYTVLSQKRISSKMKSKFGFNQDKCLNFFKIRIYYSSSIEKSLKLLFINLSNFILNMRNKEPNFEMRFCCTEILSKKLVLLCLIVF